MKTSFIFVVTLMVLSAGCGNGSTTNAASPQTAPTPSADPTGAGADVNGLCSIAFLASANHLKDVANEITEVSKSGQGVNDPRFLPALKRFDDACDEFLRPYLDTICYYQNELVRASEIKPSCDQVKDYYSRLNPSTGQNH